MGCHPHSSLLVYRNEEQMLLKIFCSMVKPSLFKGQIPILAPQVPTFAAGEILTHQHFFRIEPPTFPRNLKLSSELYSLLIGKPIHPLSMAPLSEISNSLLVKLLETTNKTQVVILIIAHKGYPYCWKSLQDDAPQL